KVRFAVAQLDVADRRGSHPAPSPAPLRRPAPQPPAPEAPLYAGHGNDRGAVALHRLAIDLLRVRVKLDRVGDAFDQGGVSHGAQCSVLSAQCSVLSGATGSTEHHALSTLFHIPDLLDNLLLARK